jgi:TPR repeat protein
LKKAVEMKINAKIGFALMAASALAVTTFFGVNDSQPPVISKAWAEPAVAPTNALSEKKPAGIVLAESRSDRRDTLYAKVSPLIAAKKYEQVLPILAQLRELCDSDAFRLTGLYYREGFGVKKDALKAIDFYEAAIELGNSAAFYEIAYIFLVGGEYYDPDVDPTAVRLPDTKQKMLPALSEALYYYHHGAMRGDGKSMLPIAKLYAFGEGVPRNHIRAYMWANLALAAETDEGKRKEISGFMDRLAGLLGFGGLSPDQIQRADDMALSCQLSGLKKCGIEPAVVASQRQVPRGGWESLIGQCTTISWRHDYANAYPRPAGILLRGFDPKTAFGRPSQSRRSAFAPPVDK